MSSSETELRVVATWRDDAEAEQPDDLTVPVQHTGEELGALSVAMSPADPLDPTKEKLVRGFDPASTGYGTGLQGIADRLGALDASLEVTSGAGAGTPLTGTVPTSPPNPEAESEVLTP